MVTREQILETQRKCEKIRKNSKCKILNESQFDFKTIEEMIKFYDAEPLDEFIRKVKGGK